MRMTEIAPPRARAATVWAGHGADRQPPVRGCTGFESSDLALPECDACWIWPRCRDRPEWPEWRGVETHDGPATGTAVDWVQVASDLVRLLLRRARAEHVDDRAVAPADQHPDRHDGCVRGWCPSGAVPAARAERRPHDLGAAHLDRAVRRAARARRGRCPRCTAASTPTRRTATATGPSSRASCRRWCTRFFRLSDRPADTFVAGLSMGGYGALKWALREPDRFAAAASLSAAADVVPAGPVRVAARAGGPGVRRRTDRRHATTTSSRSSSARSPAAIPPLYVCCGTADDGFDDNQRLVDAMRRRGLAVTDDFGPGDHDWAYWDARIQDVLAWLPLNAPASAEPTSPPARS